MPYARSPMVGARSPFFQYPSAPLARPSTGGTLDNVKEFLDKESLGVEGLKNKYLVAGALVLGLGYYGYKEGWFR